MDRNKRFCWEYSHYDSTGEIYDWNRNECLMTDYLQKYEIEEWCQELNKIVDENEQLKSDIKDCAKRYRELFNKYIKLQKETRKTEYNPPYPKRNPITYNAIPEAIYNWDD